MFFHILFLNTKFTKTADIIPMTIPASTSVGQCIKLYILEKAIAAAKIKAKTPTLLSIYISDNAPVIPFIVCPDGKEESKGIFTVS